MRKPFKVAVPDLARYTRHTGIGRVLYSLIDALADKVEVRDAKYVRSRVPVLRNFAIGLSNVPVDTDVVLFPQLTGVGALTAKTHYNSAVIVHDLGIFDSKEDYQSTDYLSRLVIRRDVRHLIYAKHIISVSEFTKDRLLTMMPELTPKVSVIQSGVSHVFYQHRKSKSHCRALLESVIGHPLGQPLLLYVGTERRRKNVTFLLDVLKLLKAEYPKLVMVKLGAPGAIQDRERVLDHMRSLDLQVDRDVYFVNNLDDEGMADVYRAADVYVSASLYEGFGLPYIESLAVGTRVVAVKTGILNDGIPGVTLVPPSVADFGAMVTRTLSTMTSIEDEQKIRAYIRGEFSWQRSANRVVETVAHPFIGTQVHVGLKGARFL